ncbi:ParA family protein [Roseomonas vastitatis]|uniref:ParA family protein n=2 Tax=Teichococcus vastitatis TaxID=2307076 RepID=A0ABS9WCW2_9PROT|nr:ParA family protein [Pseudoroseomonas vastitatis]MCI0757109.1 ParA family protein [Pseudoroseomonas vastitatis]
MAKNSQSVERRRVARPTAAQDGGSTKWLVISTAKGGSGKTTTARNLAVAAAHEGLRVLLVDTDAQQALARWAERRPEQAPPLAWEAIVLSEIGLHLDRIHASKFDVVIVDTPPGVESSPSQMQMLLRKANLVLVPVQPSDDDIESAAPWMELLARLDVPAHFLLNRVRRGSKSLDEAKLGLLETGGRLAPVEVRDLEDIRRSARAGIGVMELRGGNGADDFRGVWAFARSELGIRAR